jgi:polyisoprenoid-binding protein YceI
MATTKWVLDPTHSELGFKIKHLMISSVSGSLKSFEAEVETHGVDFTTAKISLSQIWLLSLPITTREMLIFAIPISLK